MNSNNTLLLLGGAGALAYFLLSKGGSGATETHRLTPSRLAPSAPVQPIVNIGGGGGAKPSLGVSGAGIGFSVDLSKLFGGKKTPLPPAGTKGNLAEGKTPTGVNPQLGPSADDIRSYDGASAANAAGDEYNPGPSQPEPDSANGSLDFSAGNSLDNFNYASAEAD